MGREKFVSSTLSRKRFQEILLLFNKSTEQLGDDRNKIKIVTYEGQNLVVKSFRTPNFINKIAYRFFRKSKAARSYYNALYLERNEIGTPSPVAYLEQLSAVGLHESYYVSAYTDHDFTYREITNDDDLKDQENILIQFTQFMFKMHEAGVYFLDHSPGNTLIKKVGDQYQFYLVDLNRMKFYDIPYEERLKNFERLSPKKWMYDIMGAEYARLTANDATTTIETMWKYTQEFQEAFHKKKLMKKKLKGIFKK
ncbi:MAG: lipopolysaccharide kinase InaA family protein [Nonlabens sp.]|uniref:lipopolysaccharide kinase InaA family protein n=1 Tax=Nonlabens sp. TaxID=1888209 RepID=UPI0032198F52